MAPVSEPLSPGAQGAAGVTKSQVRPDLLAWGVNQLWGLEQAVENWLVGWTPNRIPDLRGRTALVTGGSSGIGLEVARKLAQNCCRVMLVARDLAKGEAAAAHIRESLGDTVNAGTVEVLQVGSLVAEVKRRLRAADRGRDPAHPEGAGGLHMLASQAEQFATYDPDNLKGERFTDSGMQPYACAKLWLLMWGDELQRRLRAQGGDSARVDRRVRGAPGSG
eukprot:XP_001703391.1 predicted protein [Chlamydomonas reinhardtii]